jgi:hypothetical protein
VDGERLHAKSLTTKNTKGTKNFANGLSRAKKAKAAKKFSGQKIRQAQCSFHGAVELKNSQRTKIRRTRNFMNLQTFGRLFLLSFILTGCVSKQSEVAAKLGYEKSSMVKAGPYELHYAQDKSEDFVLLADGNWDVFSRYTGEGSDVYLDGHPFIHFEQNPDGSVTNLYLHVQDIHGKTEFDLIDRDGDGQWDVKIDDVSGKNYVWKNGSWIPR